MLVVRCFGAVPQAHQIFVSTALKRFTQLSISALGTLPVRSEFSSAVTMAPKRSTKKKETKAEKPSKKDSTTNGDVVEKKRTKRARKVVEDSDQSDEEPVSPVKTTKPAKKAAKRVKTEKEDEENDKATEKATSATTNYDRKGMRSAFILLPSTRIRTLASLSGEQTFLGSRLWQTH